MSKEGFKNNPLDKDVEDKSEEVPHWKKLEEAKSGKVTVENVDDMVLSEWRNDLQYQLSYNYGWDRNRDPRNFDIIIDTYNRLRKECATRAAKEGKLYLIQGDPRGTVAPDLAKIYNDLVDDPRKKLKKYKLTQFHPGGYFSPVRNSEDNPQVDEYYITEERAAELRDNPNTYGPDSVPSKIWSVEELIEQK